MSTKTQKIRVLHVIHGMDCGGAENFIMNLFRTIDRDKIQFDFLVHTKSKCYFDDEIKKLGGKIYHVPRYNLLNAHKYKNSIESFFKQHKNINIVHGHIGSCAHIYIKIAKKYGITTIVHGHSGKPYRWTLKNITYYYLVKKVRKLADYFFACSKQAGLFRYGKNIVSNKSKFKVLYNAIDLKKYKYNKQTRDQIEKELFLDKETILFGHIGSYTNVKNHKFLIKVIKEAAAINKNVKCILVGDGSLKNKIIKQIDKSNLSDNFIIEPLRNDIFKVLQRIDCLIFPSLREGLPLTLIESQAASLPCLISDNITKDVAITNCINYKSLNDSAKSWAETALNLAGHKRGIIQSDALNKQYNINLITNELEQFYLNH